MKNEKKEGIIKKKGKTTIDQTKRHLPGQGPGAKFTLTGALSPNNMETPKHDLFKNIDEES